MQIQVCRNCGNRNTVVSGELSSCNYCGSTDLEPVATIGGEAVAESSGSGSMKWIILIAAVVVLGAGGFFAMQMMGSDDSVPSKPAHPVLQNTTANKNTQTAPVQNNNVSSTAQPASTTTQTASVSPGAEATKVEQDKADTDKTNQVVQAATATAAATQVLKKEPESATKTEKPVEKTPAKVKEEVVTLAANDVKQETVEKASAKVAEKASKETITVKPTVKKETVKATSVKKVETTKPKTTKSTKTTKAKKETSVVKTKKTKESATSVAKVEKVVDKQQLRAERRSMRVLNNNNGVVSDRKTGLMWMACSIGQSWNGKSCSGEVEEYLWSEALDLAKGTSYAGYSDWRLPTRQELNSIVDCSNGRLSTKLDDKGQLNVKNGVKQDGKCVGKFQRPTIDKNVFPNTLPAFYWSYSHSSQNNYSAWGVFFSAGNQYSYNTSNFGNIRLVRNNR